MIHATGSYVIVQSLAVRSSVRDSSDQDVIEYNSDRQRFVKIERELVAEEKKRKSKKKRETSASVYSAIFRQD